MKRKANKIDTAGGEGLGQKNPFADLNLGDLPQARPDSASETVLKSGSSKPVGGNRRLEIRRLKAGKGGKTVTEVRGFENCSGTEVEQWAKQLKNRCASGGSLKNKVIEVQGDHRETAVEFFALLGFRPVLAGG